MKIIRQVGLSESNKRFQCTKGYYLNTKVALCNSFQTKQNDHYEDIPTLLKFFFFVNSRACLTIVGIRIVLASSLQSCSATLIC